MARISMWIVMLLISFELLGCATSSQLTASEQTIDKLRENNNVQVVQRGDTLKIILASDGCFDLYTTTILQSCRPALDATARVLKSYGNAPITVAGYTDNVNPPLGATSLTQRQAASVAAYLWARGGVSSQRFHPVGYGSAAPIADNINSIGSAYNRRIEITVRSVHNKN